MTPVVENRLVDIGPVLFNSPDEIAARQRVFDVAQARNAEAQKRVDAAAAKMMRVPLMRAKVHRNGQCWCGSGVKFKRCHYPNQ